MSTSPDTFICEAWATGGPEFPTRAVKISVKRDEMPGVTYMRALEAHAVGQFRVQYGAWPAVDGGKGCHWRQDGVDTAWRTVGDIINVQPRPVYIKRDGAKNTRGLPDFAVVVRLVNDEVEVCHPDTQHDLSSPNPVITPRRFDEVYVRATVPNP
jgi:hypothetical protein